MDRACVIGAGSWGTALASLLAGQVAQVRWHCHDADQALAVNRDGHNPRYFAQHAMPDGIFATADLAEALDGCSAAYLAVPCAALREVVGGSLPVWEFWQDSMIAQGSQARTPAATGPVVCNCSKGLLSRPTQRSDEWLAGVLPRAMLARLSGPNLAAEIMEGQPAAAVAASAPEQPAAASLVQHQLSSDRFRIYTGTDMVGVEVAGFGKNIIAVAAGMLHGLGLGANARAMLVTRGLAELGRLAAHFGGRQETLLGLAGVGDLIVTCGSPLSRNFQVGVRRAQGQGLPQIEAEMSETAEGIGASRALHEMGRESDVAPTNAWPELPIAQQVYRVLHEEADPREAVATLMRRPLKAE